MQEQLKSIQTLTVVIAERVVLTHNDVKYIKSFCEMQLSREQEASAKKQKWQHMPPKPAIFLGRDGLVKKVSTILSSSETASHICLLGPGGMGKTSLSLAIVGSDLVQTKFQEGHRVWIPCLEATSATLFLQVLYTSLRVKRQTDNVMSDILYELEISKEPYLLLLDNFETPWNTTDDQKQVEEVLSNLNQLSHVSILITMQGSHSPTVDVEWHSEIVPAMDKDASLRICQRFNPDWKMDPHLDSLLDAIGCMPFAVTLMATRGRESGSSPKQLLEEWTQQGSDMLSSDGSRESGTNKSISLLVDRNPSPNGSPENEMSQSTSLPVDNSSPDGSLESGMNKSIILSIDRDFVKSDPDAIDLLATLSLLPAGTTREHLGYWAPNLKSLSGAITTLSRAALIQTAAQSDDHTSQILSVLPVIQSFILRNRIPKRIREDVRSAFCKYVLEHACRYRDSKFKVNAEALAKEDVNIQSILVGATDDTGQDDHLVQALLAFSWYRRDTKPLIAVAQHTLKVAKANGNKQYIAEALVCLGSSYWEVGNSAEAKEVLKESFLMLAGDDSSQNQQLGFECTLAYLCASSFMPSHQWERQQYWEEKKTMVEDVLARTKGKNAYWHACALEALGRLCLNFEKYKQALQAFAGAAHKMKGLGCTRDMAAILEGKARTIDHLYYHPHTLAHDAVQEAWEMARHLEPSHVHGAILLLLGRVSIRMGRLVDAMNAFEKGLSAYQYIGSGLGVAQAWDHIGFLYVNTGAASDAYSAFNTSNEIYTTLGNADGQEGTTRCWFNMRAIETKLRNPHSSPGFYRPAGDRDWEHKLQIKEIWQVDAVQDDVRDTLADNVSDDSGEAELN